MLFQGLTIVGFGEDKVNRLSRKRCVELFVSSFGCKPAVAACIFEDLQTTENADARMPPEHTNLKYFLMAFNFVRTYQTEDQRELTWGLSSRTIRDWSWYYLEKLQALADDTVSASSKLFNLNLFI
jgi:hypothetical protein